MPREDFRGDSQSEDNFELEFRSGNDEQMERWDFCRSDRTDNYENDAKGKPWSSCDDLCDYLFNVNLITVPQNCQIRYLHFIECLDRKLSEKFGCIYVGLQVYQINCRQFIVIAQYENTSEVYCKYPEISRYIKCAYDRNFENSVRRCAILSFMDAELVYCSEDERR